MNKIKLFTLVALVSIFTVGCTSVPNLGHPPQFYTSDGDLKEEKVKALAKPMLTMKGPWSCDPKKMPHYPPPTLALPGQPNSHTHPAECLLEFRGNTQAILAVADVQKGETTAGVIKSFFSGLFKFGGKWKLLDTVADIAESRAPTTTTINGNDNTYERANSELVVNTADGNIGPTATSGDSRDGDESTYGDGSGNSEFELTLNNGTNQNSEIDESDHSVETEEVDNSDNSVVNTTTSTGDNNSDNSNN